MATITAINSGTIDNTTRDDNEVGTNAIPSISIATILTCSDFKETQKIISSFYTSTRDTSRQSSKRPRSNWDDGANEKLKQLVQCCKNEHQKCTPQLLRDLLYHLGGFGPYSTRTITRHLNMILPKNNTNAYNNATVEHDTNADDNTTTNEDDTTDGTGDISGTNNVSMDVHEDTSYANLPGDANLPVDTSITLHIPAKQTALTEVERLLCWLVVYKHHNIDNKNDLQRLQWGIITNNINSYKLRLLRANQELDHPRDIPKLNENTQKEKYAEHFKGQRRSYTSRVVNRNWKSWIKNQAITSCNEFIHKYPQLGQIVNQIRTEILQ
jgi:hypothetical protein